MNREETLALWKQGKEAWNRWAEEMLAERERLEKAGEWVAGIDTLGNIEPKNNATNTWLAAAIANFSGCVFHESADFTSFVFPGHADFTPITHKDKKSEDVAQPVHFGKDACFEEAQFSGEAWFDEAHFGGDAWFKWVKFGGQARFDKAQFCGQARFDGTQFGSDARFDKTRFSVNTQYDGALFGGFAVFAKARFDEVRFDGARFTRRAGFDEAQFGGDVRFDETIFKEDAAFGAAQFDGEVLFNGAQIDGNAWFDKVLFAGDAWFDGARFKGSIYFTPHSFWGKKERVVRFAKHASFATAQFLGPGSFNEVVFEQPASFNAVTVESAFTLEGAQFAQLPDFRQAHFTEAPSLDSMKLLPSVEPAGFWRSIFHPVSLDVISKYRTLKRLAIQGHDHEQEQIFFRGELRARRGTLDRIWHWRWWFGIFYEVFSDFGRSLFRPLAGWFFTMTGFAFYYLSRHFALHNPAYSTDLWGWLGGAIKNLVSGQGASTPDLTCMSGKGEPLAAAIYLSMKKGLLALGWEQSEKLNQTYSCLYGVDVRQMAGGSVADLAPVIPYNVSFMAIPQTVLSAAFIFLFLLALRNQFRIR